MLKKDTLSHYCETHQIEWASTLPENCPPENILVPEEEEFYRLLINEDTIIEEDWKSQKELHPDKSYEGEDLINAHGLSLLKEADHNTFKLPRFKRFKGLAKIILNPTDGVLKKTYYDNHYTWWRTTSFDENSVEIVNNEKA
jgi:hypothetical protein